MSEIVIWKDIKMTEDEAREMNISRIAAINFIKKHYLEEHRNSIVREFLDEVEPLENGLFSGKDVLNWLGY
jgi:hypothetical protein